MHAVYELKEKLCDELEEYGKKDKLDVGALDIVDKLAHTIKNLDKIIEVLANHLERMHPRSRRRPPLQTSASIPLRLLRS